MRGIASGVSFRLILLAALFVAGLFPQTSAAEDHFYIVGGRLHVGDGRVIDDAVIEVTGERIVSVTDSSGTRNEGVAVIDAVGMVITPGLIAGASQLGLVEISGEAGTRDTERTSTGAIHAGYDPAPAINARSSLIPVQAIAGITSAAVAPTGSLLSGQVAFIDLAFGDFAGIVAKPRIAVRGRLRSSFEGSRAAALGRLREALDDARFFASHRKQHDRGELRELIAHPLDLAALIPVLERDVPLIMWSDRAGDILALVALAREQGVRLVIEGGAESWLVADVLAAANVPVLLTPTHNLPGQLDSLGARLDTAARLVNAGVAIGIVEGGAHNVRNIRQEAGIAVANGLPWEDALHAVTLGIATIHGVDGDYGSVERGKVANLVVWDGDPFELSSAPARVFIRGEQIPMVSRQTILRDRYLDLSGRRP